MCMLLFAKLMTLFMHICSLQSKQNVHAQYLYMSECAFHACVYANDKNHHWSYYVHHYILQ